MANQEQSPKGVPHPDRERPGPDLGQTRSDGRSDGPRKIGLASDDQPDLVAPSGVNQGDHGVADDKPMAGGPVNLDDDDLAHPRGRSTAKGGTWKAEGADSAPLGPPGAGLSDRNGPSDPDLEKQ